MSAYYEKINIEVFPNVHKKGGYTHQYGKENTIGKEKEKGGAEEGFSFRKEVHKGSLNIIRHLHKSPKKKSQTTRQNEDSGITRHETRKKKEKTRFGIA